MHALPAGAMTMGGAVAREGGYLGRNGYRMSLTDPDAAGMLTHHRSAALVVEPRAQAGTSE